MKSLQKEQGARKRTQVYTFGGNNMQLSDTTIVLELPAGLKEWNVEKDKKDSAAEATS